jgi:hypothetical protein
MGYAEEVQKQCTNKQHLYETWHGDVVSVVVVKNE